MKNRQNSALARSTLSLYALQIAKYAFPFVVIPYLTRTLGPDAYGIRAFVLSIMTSVQLIADFGFTNYGIREVVLCKGDKENVSRVMSSITYSKLILIAGLSVGVAAMTLVTPLMMENWAYVSIAFMAVALTTLLPDFVFRGYEKMEVITFRYVVSKGATTLFTFILIHSASDLIMVPLLDLLGALIALVWSMVAIFRDFSLRFVAVSLRHAIADLKASAIYFVSGAATVVFSSLTTFMMGVFNGNLNDIACWSLATTVVNAADALCGPLTNALYPNMMKKGSEQVASGLRRLFLCVFPLLLAVTVVIAVFNQPIMAILGGDGYVDKSWVIALVSPVVALTFYTSLMGWPALGATGHVKELTETTLWSMAFHIAMLLLMAAAGMYTLALVAVTRVASSAVLLALRYRACSKCGAL